MKVWQTVLACVLLGLVFMSFLWHMSVFRLEMANGVTQTGGLFNVSTEKAYIFAEYGLIAVVICYNALVIYLLTFRKHCNIHPANVRKKR